MIVTAYYNNGTGEVVTDYSTNGYDLTQGLKEITVLYNDFSDLFQVEVRGVLGDRNHDNIVTDADALYLLYHTIFGAAYPIGQDFDYNGDASVPDADASYLLYHTIFEDSYPLK